MDYLKFSIIIPVYNVEEYLQRCVESVVCQNYPEEYVQVLLINDGSTDGSGALAEHLAKGHANVQVYHKENGGLSDARNYGLARAEGEYVFFLDSDDYLSLDSLLNFNKAIQKCSTKPDIVAGTTIKHIGEQEIPVIRATAGLPLMTGEQFLLQELRCNRLFVAAWASIYQRRFLEENQLFFWKGMIHEDEDFTPRAFLKAKQVLSTDICFYHYMIRPDSITTKKDRTRNAECIFEISRHLTPLFDQMENRELKDLLKTHLAKIMLKITYDANLYQKDKRDIIDHRIIRQNCIFLSEKIRYLILRMSPRLLHLIMNLRS